jgi:hypothetical protein
MILNIITSSVSAPNISGIMQAESKIDDSGEKGHPIRDVSLSQEGQGSVTSVEDALEDPQAKRLTRKLLRKLDTR